MFAWTNITAHNDPQPDPTIPVEVLAGELKPSPVMTLFTPCAENDEIIVLTIGASQLRGNSLPLLQNRQQAHKVVLNSPSPFNKNTHPLIFLRGSTHQKSESVNTQQREVI